MMQENFPLEDVNLRSDNYNYCRFVSGGMYIKYLSQILCFLTYSIFISKHK
jgi:hypothetical protein